MEESSIGLAEGVEIYLDYLRDVKKSPVNTVSSYERDLRNFLIFANGRSAEDRAFTKGTIADYITHMTERNLAGSSVIRSATAIRSMCRHLANSRFLDSDPTLCMELPEKAKIKKDETPDRDILSIVLRSGTDARKARDTAMFSLLYYSGARVGQILALNLDDMDLNARTFRILKKNGAAKKYERLPIDEAAIQAVSAYLNETRPQLLRNAGEGALFLNASGERLSRQGFWKLLKAAAAAAGAAGVTTQSLRRAHKK